MSSPVHTVQFDDIAERAWQRMFASRIHHVVVMDGDHVVGVLSDRDLGGEKNPAVRAGKTAGELMSPTVVTAEAGMTVREAANKLRGHIIGCLPVMEGERLVGMITIADLLQLLGRGVDRPSKAERRFKHA